MCYSYYNIVPCKHLNIIFKRYWFDKDFGLITQMDGVWPWSYALGF